ncbi:hypothetical protein [Streptomyces sp. 184]|uniref:hypothetical protein n=1 Tax=Streptomyces sp. 184 TaxID=1827526 RepID=UPI0038922473
MSIIDELWSGFELPIRDALHIGGGKSYDVTLAPAAPAGLRIQDPFDLAAFVAADPGWTSAVDGLTEVECGGGDLIWAGEGSYGSEGFAARLHRDRTLVWAVFFADSNPFTEIRTSERKATFLSTSGVGITLDVDDPTA